MVVGLQVLLGLVVILYIVGIVFSTKTWKWFHITMLAFVFIATFFFLAYAGMVLKTRKTWGEIYVKLQKDLKPYVEANQKLIVGDPSTASDPLATLPRVKGALQRVLIGRGRVWRGCTVGDVNEMARTVTLGTPVPPPPPAAPGAEPAEPPPNGIAEKSVLYGFLEEKISDTLNFNAPRVYLGEFEATAVTANTVTLRPTIPLDQFQVAAMRTGTWALYEICPTDSSEAIDELFKAFKTEVNEEQLKNLIRKTPDTLAESYDRTIQQYARDGKPALPDDPPARVWVKVKFKAKYEVPVDSSAMQSGMESEYFDLNGLAIAPTLRKGGTVEFKNGDFAIVNQQKADELIASGVCEKVESVYRRELHDYKHHFHEILVRTDYLTNRIAEVKRQVDILLEAQKRTQTQIDYRTQEKAKLQQDLAKFEFERNAVTEYRDALVARRDAVRARILELYKANLASAEELATMQQQMTDEINKRTLEAAESTSTSVPTSTATTP